MSLLPSCVAPNPEGYYFAKANNDTVVAPGFIANGSGPSSGFVVSNTNSANFIAQAEDTLGTGKTAFTIREDTGLRRWTIDNIGIEGGANSGSDLAIVSYSDDGSVRNTNIGIDRLTGKVILPITTAGLEVDGTATVGTATTGGGGVLSVNGPSGVSRVYDPIYNPVPVPPSVGGWTVFFEQKSASTIDLPAIGNSSIFTIPLPPALQNATKYTVRVLDMSIGLIQGSQLDRVLVYFDYNVNNRGISYVSGGAGTTSGCDNNFIWLDNKTGGSGSTLATGSTFTEPTGDVNVPPAPFSNNAYYGGSVPPSGSYNPQVASLNLPVFNIYNYNGDTGITNLYMVFNPDPNDGTQVVGVLAGNARLRCIVEASFAPKY